eukprot:8622605-Pyramimonas_sp.AAC.1
MVLQVVRQPARLVALVEPRRQVVLKHLWRGQRIGVRTSPRTRRPPRPRGRPCRAQGAGGEGEGRSPAEADPRQRCGAGPSHMFPPDVDTENIESDTDKARLSEIGASIRTIGESKDPFFTKVKQELVTESDPLKEKILRAKPLASQLNQLVNRCQTLEKKRDDHTEA